MPKRIKRISPFPTTIPQLAEDAKQENTPQPNEGLPRFQDYIMSNRYQSVLEQLIKKHDSIGKISSIEDEECKDEQNIQEEIMWEQLPEQMIDSSQRIINSEQYIDVSEIDFKIFLDTYSRTKIFAVLLINCDGKILYSDKLGHELFEGSLNNFLNIRIQDLVLGTIRQSLLEELKCQDRFNQNKIFNWAIYSKNTKRRYCTLPFEQLNEAAIFYRFLKGISLRLRPVNIHFKAYEEIEGFWNYQMISNRRSKKCFLMEARLSETTPQVSHKDLFSDQLLNKYIKNSLKKVAEIGKIGENEQMVKLENHLSEMMEKYNGKERDIIICKPKQKRAYKISKRRRHLKKKKEQEQQNYGVNLFEKVSIDDI